MNVYQFSSNYKGADSSIKVSDPGNGHDNVVYKMSKYQGDSEKGFNGYVEMMAVSQAIGKAIDHVIVNNKGLVGESMKRLIANEIKPKEGKGFSVLKNNKIDDEDFEFNVEVFVRLRDIDESDSIKLSHYPKNSFSTRNDEKGFKEDDLNIHVGKWQGDSEKGAEGVYRLLALQKSIDMASKEVLAVFPDFADRLESIHNVEPGVEDKGLEL